MYRDWVKVFRTKDDQQLLVTSGPVEESDEYPDAAEGMYKMRIQCQIGGVSAGITSMYNTLEEMEKAFQALNQEAVDAIKDGILQFFDHPEGCECCTGPSEEFKDQYVIEFEKQYQVCEHGELVGCTCENDQDCSDRVRSCR